MSNPLASVPHPLIFEINARQLTQENARRLGRTDATLADVPESEIQSWARAGYDAIWLMGVWTTGEASRRLSSARPGFTTHYPAALPDWAREDVCGSPYAVADYSVPEAFGGPDALAALRRRLHASGIGLILDFVPNHTARDHPWVSEDPDLYVHGTDDQAANDPDNYAAQDGRVFAFGRDPYFPGWVDTFQLDYRRPATRRRMVDTLLTIAEHCDGVRCDMAMLVLPDIFDGTWGGLPEGNADGAFWPEAIDAVRARHPGFRFIAEAYWGLEGRLRLLGFDYTYNKPLYDALVHDQAGEIRANVLAEDALGHSVQFLENHDEPRAAAAIRDPGRRHAATAFIATLPGARLIHDGQVEGRRWPHSIHLSRRQYEEPDAGELAFFERLFTALAASTVGRGTWRRIEPLGWPGNATHHALHACAWEGPAARHDLVVINLSPDPAEAHLPVRFQGIAGRQWRLADRLSDAVYVRDGDAMSGEGLYVRLEPYQAQIFAMTRASDA